MRARPYARRPASRGLRSASMPTWARAQVTLFHGWQRGARAPAPPATESGPPSGLRDLRPGDMASAKRAQPGSAGPLPSPSRALGRSRRYIADSRRHDPRAAHAWPGGRQRCGGGVRARPALLARRTGLAPGVDVLLLEGGRSSSSAAPTARSGGDRSPTRRGRRPHDRLPGGSRCAKSWTTCSPGRRGQIVAEVAHRTSILPLVLQGVAGRAAGIRAASIPAR